MVIFWPVRKMSFAWESMAQKNDSWTCVIILIMQHFKSNGRKNII